MFYYLRHYFYFIILHIYLLRLFIAFNIPTHAYAAATPALPTHFTRPRLPRHRALYLPRCLRLHLPVPAIFVCDIYFTIPACIFVFLFILPTHLAVLFCCNWPHRIICVLPLPPHPVFWHFCCSRAAFAATCAARLPAAPSCLPTPHPRPDATPFCLYIFPAFYPVTRMASSKENRIPAYRILMDEDVKR